MEYLKLYNCVQTNVYYQIWILSLNCRIVYKFSSLNHNRVQVLKESERATPPRIQ